MFDEEIDHEGEPSSVNSDDDDVNSYDVEESDTVVVPQVRMPLSLQDLAININPRQQANDFGKQLYIETVHKLFDLMKMMDCFSAQFSTMPVQFSKLVDYKVHFHWIRNNCFLST